MFDINFLNIIAIVAVKRQSIICIRVCRRFVIWCLAVQSLVIPLVLVACNYIVSPDGSIQKPLINPLPINVGVYYGSLGRDFEDNDTGGVKYRIRGPSKVLFAQLLTASFQSVTEIEHWPGTESAYSDISAIFIPHIEHFSIFLREGITEKNQEFLSVYTADITYRMTVYSSANKELGSWTVSGKGVVRGTAFWEKKHWTQAVELAMREAAADFLAGLSEEPAVEKLLRDKNP